MFLRKLKYNNEKTNQPVGPSEQSYIQLFAMHFEIIESPDTHQW